MPIAWLDAGTILAGSPIQRVDAGTGQSQVVPGLKQASESTYRFGTAVVLSPDRARIFFSMAEDGRPDADGLRTLKLVSQRLDGSDEKLVCRTKSRLTMLHSLAVSPDGRYVAFGALLPSPAATTKREGDSQAVIKIVPVDGGEERIMFTQSWWGAAWSADSRYLLVRGGEGDSQLFSVTVATGELRPTGLKSFGVPMAMAPDGRRLAFVRGSYAEEIIALPNLLKTGTKPGR